MAHCWLVIKIDHTDRELAIIALTLSVRVSESVEFNIALERVGFTRHC